MKSHTLDELMIVNPGSPAAIEMLHVRSGGLRGRCRCACRQPVTPRLFLGSDGIVYQVDRTNVRGLGRHYLAADGTLYAVDR
jgi:hypothetical protein